MKYQRWLALYGTTAMLVVLGTTTTALAQAPGTNVPTPAPPPPAAAPEDPLLVATPPPRPISEEPVIDAATTQSRVPNRPLLVTGLVVFGASYGAAAVVAATSERPADDKLYYPVVGPWLDLNQRGCSENPCEHNTRDRVLLVVDGVLQGAGALGMVLSLVVPEKTTRNWYLIGNKDFVLVPRFGGGTAGLGAVGRF